MTEYGAPVASRWPHRVAILLACAVFPLIWVGGLVTTTNSGMSVPDWPNTYGYNLFLYPWQTWLTGPWDLFLEHGHRLLGALAGLLAIALVVAVWLTDQRTSIRALAVGILLAVVGQGTLGGMRVLFDARLLAMVHAMVGPAFFALCVATATLLSDAPKPDVADPADERADRARVRTAAVTVVLAYGQIVLGALARHVPAAADPGTFRVVILLHLAAAALLLLHALMLAAGSVRLPWRRPAPVRGAWLLVGLITLQVVLGSTTWIATYGWPRWSQAFDRLATYTVHASGHLQTWVVTAHVANGSLILAVAIWIPLVAWRRNLLPVDRPEAAGHHTAPDRPTLACTRIGRPKWARAGLSGRVTA